MIKIKYICKNSYTAMRVQNNLLRSFMINGKGISDKERELVKQGKITIATDDKDDNTIVMMVDADKDYEDSEMSQWESKKGKILTFGNRIKLWAMGMKIEVERM